MRGRVAVAVVGVALSVAGCGYERDLSEGEIRALFEGARVEGHHDLHGYDFWSDYEDARYTSHQSDRTQPRGAAWWTRGDEMCIRWDDEGQDRCRFITTDDQGGYWKVMVNRRGRRRTIVTYRAFTGPGGEDRRVTVDRGTLLRRQLTTGYLGIFLAGVAIVLALLFLRLVTRGKDEPFSPRNRMRRRLGALRAGNRSFRWSEVERDPAALAAFALGSVRDRDAIQTAWALREHVDQAGGYGLGWRRFWGAVSSLSDQELILALGPACALEVDAPALRQAFRNDLRACYVVGYTYQQLAVAHQRELGPFTRYKDAALALLADARQEAGPPPDLVPDGAPYRSPGSPSAPDYAAMAGPAFETIMYMQHVAPPKPAKSSSSSYSGGG